LARPHSYLCLIGGACYIFIYVYIISAGRLSNHQDHALRQFPPLVVARIGLHKNVCLASSAKKNQRFLIVFQKLMTKKSSLK
jgi:hypothetical protein